jgi:hypothetical protein
MDVTILVFVEILVTVLTVLRIVLVVLSLNLVTVLRLGQQYFADGPEVLPKVAPMGQAAQRLR